MIDEKVLEKMERISKVSNAYFSWECMFCAEDVDTETHLCKTCGEKNSDKKYLEKIEEILDSGDVEYYASWLESFLIVFKHEDLGNYWTYDSVAELRQKLKIWRDNIDVAQ